MFVYLSTLDLFTNHLAAVTVFLFAVCKVNSLSLSLSQLDSTMSGLEVEFGSEFAFE